MVATETILLRCDRAPLERPVKRIADSESGAVIYGGLAAVEGVQPYPELGDVAEYVGRAALVATVAGLIGSPIFLGQSANGRILHPGQAAGALAVAKPTTWRDHTVGTVLDARLVMVDPANPIDADGYPIIHEESADTPSYLLAVWVRCSILDAAAQAVIQSRAARALSPLYTATLDQTPGEFRGQRFTSTQTGRSINNLCLVDSGRGGDLCVLRADATGASMATFSLDELQTYLDGVPVENAAAKALIMAKLATMKGGEATDIEIATAVDADPAAPPPEDIAAMKADAAALRKSNAALKAELDAIKAAKEAELLRADAMRADAAAKNANATLDGWDAAKATRAQVDALNGAILAKLAEGPRADVRYTPPTGSTTTPAATPSPLLF